MKSPLKWHNQPGKKRGLLESLSSLLRLFMKHLQALIGCYPVRFCMDAMLIKMVLKLRKVPKKSSMISLQMFNQCCLIVVMLPWHLLLLQSLGRL